MRLQDNFGYFAMVQGDREFARCGNRSLTYAEADLEANRLANLILSHGLKPGDRFAYLSKNSIDYALVFFAAARTGTVPVPLNYRLAPAEWSYIINDAGSKLLFAAKELVEAVDPVRPELKDALACYAIDAEVPDGWTDYRAAIAAQSTDRPDDLAITGDDPIYQMYTSGTTGRPKGAVLLHRNALANLEQIRVAVDHRITREENILVCAPMYHAAGAIISLYGLHSGGGLVIHEDFIPSDVVDSLEKDRIAVTVLVPAMIQACLVMVPDVAERDYKDLKAMVYGASPIAEETLRGGMDAFGCGFYQAFGMTETTAAVVYLNAADHQRALKDKPELLLAAGRAVPGTEIRIVDEDDREMPRGEIGEVIARGPQIMQGYWNMAEATEKALKGGWMHTGDAGIMDDEGYLYIQDRIKDMIVSGGENVYPREVENALFEHPAIADAAVFGIPGEKFGEDVMAAIVLREGESLTEEEVIAYAKTQLGGYKVPRKIQFLPELPRNASGKVLKKDLRAPYWEGQERQVS